MDADIIELNRKLYEWDRYQELERLHRRINELEVRIIELEEKGKRKSNRRRGRKCIKSLKI